MTVKAVPLRRQRSEVRILSGGPFKETDVMSVFLCPHETDETNLPGADLS